ncbi:MAG: YdeI/OmpD-associated family protein [Alphaproteobacteria bacterium]|nr:YdeI/OmpD-associated family protein [Alphaproteobacteria bacterium]
MPPNDDAFPQGKDGLAIRGFESGTAFGAWLAEEHTSCPGIWLQIPKKGSTVSGPTYGEALEEALRFGWIDSQKASADADVYLQRFTPRKARSPWSKVNRTKAEALIAAGRMEPAGQREVDAARTDGRWDRAYAGSRTITVPPDLQAALDADPAASAFFATLSSANRYAILYRVHEAKRAETRARRIEKFVAMCARGETVH